jgi:hypothetical protein
VKTFFRVLAFLCLAFALVGLATEIDDAREGRTKDRAIGVAMIFIFAGGGALLWRASRRPKPEAPAAPEHEAMPPPASRPATENQPLPPDDDFK